MASVKAVGSAKAMGSGEGPVTAAPAKAPSNWKLKALKKGDLKANFERRQKRLAASREKSSAELKARAEARKAKWKNASAEQKTAWKAKRAARLAAAGKAGAMGSGEAGAGGAVKTTAPVAPKKRHLRAAARQKRKGAELSKIE